MTAVYAVPIADQNDTLLLLRWLSDLYLARALRGISHALAITDAGVTLNVLIDEPTLAGRILLDVAFSSPRCPFVLARLWQLPGCCAGIAQDLGWPVPEVRHALESLAAAGLAYEHRGVWRVRPLQNGGAA